MIKEKPFLYSFSKQEVLVMNCLKENGYDRKLVAKKLGITRKMTSFWIKQVFNKMGFHEVTLHRLMKPEKLKIYVDQYFLFVKDEYCRQLEKEF